MKLYRIRSMNDAYIHYINLECVLDVVEREKDYHLILAGDRYNNFNISKEDGTALIRRLQQISN